MSNKRTKKDERATIFDVASLAGVSIKTVSRVVNNEPNVHAKTRDKVMKAVAKLQYRPNSAARGLSGKRSYVIGLVYENPQEFSYMKDVLNGVLEACEREGYLLLLRPLTLPNESLVDEIRQFALQARLDGIVLPAPLGDFAEVLELLRDQRIPYARIAPKEPNGEGISIFCTDEAASRALTEYLIGQGHRRIGFIRGHPDHGASEKRLRGYRTALEAHGLRFSTTLVKQGFFDFESGQAAAGRLLSMRNPPSAIIASNDDMAVGVMFEANRRGIGIPAELSVVGFDDTPIASRIWPPLTTVRQPIAEMAATATQLLIRRLRGEDVGSPETPLDCEVVIRDSAGPV